MYGGNDTTYIHILQLLNKVEWKAGNVTYNLRLRAPKVKEHHANSIV